MSQSLKVKKLLSEVLSLLDPYSNFARMIKFYHNSMEVQGRNLDLGENVHIFGLGKAASFEVAALKKLLKQQNSNLKIAQCVSYTKIDHAVDDPEIYQIEGTHPVITAVNIDNTKVFIEKLKSIPENDSLIFLLSGGGSALLELPINGLSFEELQKKHEELLSSGKNINQINLERKALSLVKNGGLLDFIKTKLIYQFVTCDIPNENLVDVSSGPLLKAGDEVIHPVSFKTQSASVLLDQLSQTLDLKVDKIYDCSIDELINEVTAKLPELGETIISGGEAPIVLPPKPGKGGRNTHFVLAMAEKVYAKPENRNLHILSIGTDGGDGPTDAAGAYINYELYQSLDAEIYLKQFDSYSYFDKLNTLIKTGPTKTNVMDLRCIWRA